MDTKPPYQLNLPLEKTNRTVTVYVSEWAELCGVGR